CDMPLFDAIATTFGTAGTGGFGIKNDSVGGYSASIQWVVTVFMIAFGVNFNAYFLLLIKKWKQAFASEEVRWYFAIIFAAVAIIVYNTYGMYSSLSEALRHTFFQVGSVITTTGYSTVNFDLWPEASKTVLLILMFVGACAGSTGGGIKVSRIMILIKSMGKEIKQYYHPRLVGKIRLEGQIVEHEVVRNTNTYIVLYLLIFIASLLAISFDGKDFITNFSGVAATLNNIGPGLNLVGPTCNFSVFSPFSKLVLIFDMLAGRLELFPMLLLFTKETWRKY
ncbi:MAG: TrkH family potassium uptake protein, partial [Erysipelotrichaceae bacterium]|nr:TrkH family potassium uptake protein [Erysipelotrichaceae bacterium]